MRLGIGSVLPACAAGVVAVALCGVRAHAATYQEKGGQVVVEAEHFDSRVDNSNGNVWRVVPTENPGVSTFSGARGTYLQAVPDLTTNNNGSTTGLPSVDYKVHIDTTGTYQLYLRWDGFDGSSDSIYGRIVGLSDSYRYSKQFDPNAATTADANFDTDPWQGSTGVLKNGTSGSGGTDPALFTIATAGDYTIRLNMREDGAAVDALVLQLSSLPAPTGVGPAESGTVVPEPASLGAAAMAACALLARRRR